MEFAKEHERYYFAKNGPLQIKEFRSSTIYIYICIGIYIYNYTMYIYYIYTPILYN